MATRKIRLTLSGTQVDSQGPIVDVDFNGVNLDADVDVTGITGTSTTVKEYTVDVDAGTYNLDIVFKNDAGGDDGDRNFTVESVETANDGTNYSRFVITTTNSNEDNPPPYGLQRVPNPDYDESGPDDDTNNRNTINPSYDSGAARTDIHWDPLGDLGSNPKYVYETVTQNSLTYYTNHTLTLNVTFS